jgi:serine/threonine protein kinase
VGTSFYRAPELMQKGHYYGQKVDMYALGIIMMEMYYHFDTSMERKEVLTTLKN